MFAKLTIGIFRAWQAKRKVVALVIQSHGEHTEAVVLCDDVGSAYQITLHAAGFYFRPSLTVAEYVPETMRVLNKISFLTSVLSLRSDLDRALAQVFSWISDNKSKRLPQEEEMKLVESMFAKGKTPNKAPEPTPGPVTPRAME